MYRLDRTYSIKQMAVSRQ